MSEESVYVKVELAGYGTTIWPVGSFGAITDCELQPAIDDEAMDCKWILTLVQMTPEAYEAMPEFEGY